MLTVAQRSVHARSHRCGQTWKILQSSILSRIGSTKIIDAYKRLDETRSMPQPLVKLAA
jgi:hypothetical protein